MRLYSRNGRVIALAATLVLPLLTLPSTEASTAGERAQCQCSVDGLSGGSDVFYEEEAWGNAYRSKNIDTGATPYEFIGCGAHKFYYDDHSRQVAGYPWRLCYTYGGKIGCTITELSQNHYLSRAFGYRFCNGDYDCDAKADRYVRKGTVVAKLTLDEIDSDGHFQDWTNCCQECRLLQISDGGNREPTKCVGWDFDVETMECRLFSKLDQVSWIGARSARAPFWYSGTPGFDDAPVSCWRRNKYDTCKGNFILIFVVSMLFGFAGLLCFICLNWSIFTRCYGWTTDVTPQAPRYQTRISFVNKGGSTTHQVTIYQALIVYRINGFLKRKVVCSHRNIIQDEKYFFRVASENKFKGIGQTFQYTGFSIWIPLCLTMISMVCLMVISFQVFLTDGGRFQAAYLFPGVGKHSTVVWGIVACYLAVAMILTLPLAWWLHLWTPKPRFFRPENTHIRPVGSGTDDAESVGSISCATTTDASFRVLEIS